VEARSGDRLGVVRTELEAMGVVPTSLEPIREKDGIFVVRVRADGRTSVLKCFANPSHRREIAAYSLLGELGVATLRVLAATQSAILLEDIDASGRLRLGEPGDLADPLVASRLARWYRVLHDAGAGFVIGAGADLYDETDVITEANLEAVARRTGTESLPVWGVLRARLEEIKARVRALPRTLTYNDFAFTNLAVTRDSALMFDYNLLGKGYVYSDLRNVCASLAEDAAAAFLDAYGEFDRTQAVVDDVAAPLVALHFACQRSRFPSWAKPELHVLEHDLARRVEALLSGEV
jgi:hypothetical protein